MRQLAEKFYTALTKFTANLDHAFTQMAIVMLEMISVFEPSFSLTWGLLISDPQYSFRTIGSRYGRS